MPLITTPLCALKPILFQDDLFLANYIYINSIYK